MKLKKYKILRISTLFLAGLVFGVPGGAAGELAALSGPATISGLASWYGAAYRGRPTASGERFDPADLTAAHPSLPMGTVVEVSRPERGRAVVVRINDRGPAGGRVIDLSEAAARRLGMIAEGIAPVTVTVIGRAD
ncbi:septal ring lytic transglycosylase RlpA family protein [Magnetospirillum sp. SS-4]|uniref:septal ring lytic transglycosylase RlpA family protein n=1 Tax=Magnetospirillum sp. SS-4 TaxID=2681465 RepID=UPI0020C310E9|nr:septal ring lytic transglycosylase RlpA family protein [Magnetospirillum sp. SS-4]